MRKTSRATGLVPGFTLLELMMVVGIIGLIAAMGVPSILSTMRQEPMRRAVNDVTRICFNARAQAIQQNKTVVVDFHPVVRKIEIEGGGTGTMPAGPGQTASNAIEFDPSIVVKMLSINLMDFDQADIAYVRFFPNGTCDEMILALQSADQSRKITLDPITSLTSVGAIR
ncbi:MAG TPA: prepilin-type N-terminal cleavage/methylation domain-containing protein [Verrucomicrobiae bacterium]